MPVAVLSDSETVARPGRFPIYDPATGEIVDTVPLCSPADVDAATAKAEWAFPQWAETPGPKRRERMLAVAQAIRAHAEDLARLLTREQGKPLPQARGEVNRVVELLTFHAEDARRVQGTLPPADHVERMVLVTREPVGVVAAITPWNEPLALLARMLGPALAAGCTVVAKPASDTPLSTIALADIARQAGLAEGVFGVVTGPGSTVGDALVTHPRVRKVSFTGSLETGRRIAALAGAGIKRLTLELGGQCPGIVCADANLDIAGDAITFQAFRNAGQLCNRVNRVYVERSVAAPLLDRLVEKARRIVVGPGAAEGVDMGPLINQRQLEKVHLHVEDALHKGGRLLCGGQRLRGEAFDRGWYYPPTIIAGAPPEALVMREETFGPVVGFAEVDSLEEAVRLANDTEYGLASFLFTGDIRRGLEIAHRLDAGSVWVNDIHGSYLQCPYGGMKASGLGREQSDEAVREYLETKTIYLDMAEGNRGGYLMVH